MKTLDRKQLSRWSTLKRALRPRGQAMVEYTVVAHFLFVVGGVAFFPLIIAFFKALNTFYQSVFFVLQRSTL